MTNSCNCLKTVSERFEELLLKGFFRENFSQGPEVTADSLLEGLQCANDGTSSWADIDYADQSRSRWQAAAHYIRLETAAVRGGSRLCADAEFRSKVVSALRFWLKNDFVNPNWWHNEIGMPAHIGDIAISLRNYLNTEDKEKCVELVARGSVKNRPAALKRSGANLIWIAMNTIRHAVLTDDEALLKLASDRIAEELRNGREGIRPDGAFIQHGPRWYSGGYGASFTFDLSLVVYLLNGTDCALPSDCLESFLRHVCKGQRHMSVHGYFDPNGVGREITRPGALRNAELMAAIRLLATIKDIPGSTELADFVDDIDGKDGVDDTYYYPSVSYLSHRSGAGFIGVKCLDGHNMDAEICNGEGELCYNMSYGTRTSMMSRGDEYYDLTPLFDWSAVPGTTSMRETDAELLARKGWWERRLPDGSCQACVDGSRGMISQHTEHDGISLTASYFLFDGRMIALGTDIKKPEGTELFTTVDQCHSVNPEFSESCKATANGAFGYMSLLPDEPLSVSVKHVTGSWHRNNGDLSDSPVTGDVFLCGIAIPEGRDCYAYAVVPRNESLGARVIINSPSVQAVELEDGTVMAAFHEQAELSAGAKTIFGKKGECVIVRPV